MMTLVSGATMASGQTLWERAEQLQCHVGRAPAKPSSLHSGGAHYSRHCQEAEQQLPDAFVSYCLLWGLDYT